MEVQKIQGLIFCFAALFMAAFAVVLGSLDSQVELILVAVLILILGVPHGALDTLFAWKIYRLQTLRAWAFFGVAYLLLALSVVGLWFVFPVVFLCGFLLISALHFSGDPVHGTPWAARLLYGGAILVLPTLLHESEVTRLFTLLVGPEPAALTAMGLSLLAWPWLIGLTIATAERARVDWRTACEMGSAGVLSVLAPPLLAFVVLFCGMHSARHILRTIDYSGRMRLSVLLLAAALPMFGVLAMTAIVWFFRQDTPLDARVIQLVFVGLAALTVPHMALVERVRFRDWIPSATSQA
jgi:Brp/Blh family beta-carotene 15,15'-monooxygenase